MYSPTRIQLFNLLNGILCIYKLPGISVEKLTRNVKRSLANAFNSLPSERQSVRTTIQTSGAVNNKSLKIIAEPDIVDNDLVLGRRFLPGDIMLYPIDSLSEFMSGVQVYGVGEDGVYNNALKFEQSSWLKTYHLTCMMGRASTDGTADSTTLLRASWRHVQKSKIDHVLAGLQAQFNASTLLQSGLRPNSQNAYLALCGRSAGSDLRPVKPTHLVEDYEGEEQLLSPWERPLPDEKPNPKTLPDRKYEWEEERRQMAPYVNGLRCIDFDPPFFTIEIQVAHETLKFLIDLVANLGPKLRTATLLSKARRVRHGPLTAENSLLMKHLHCIPIEFYNEFIQCVNDLLMQYEGHDTDLSMPFEIDFEEDPNLLKLLMNRTHNKYGYHVYENLFKCNQLYSVGIERSKEMKRYMVPINS
ncbi:Mitochondrial mRNA pseudouridine synthase Trub2 [Schistosoma japonicum]|uniref:Mitochondrial mRNA pseudouridine synthase Trub2 n=1 Tax=Schistosoma japonicum TaxID=6182 RepID=A0A4Z2D0K4_SCHJA|nr:Mitochondrial mRNA pseudouridine synthase Trub2 [Schistosoma japonicum]TNN09994.1 Mitochondrial mRNA pseudouridine synthase Trub2 [Schistosoma japonicum]